MSGDLLCRHTAANVRSKQEASLLPTDFPVALLQPAFRALPQLQHAQPAAGLQSEHP